jgi:hypothetical protein
MKSQINLNNKIIEIQITISIVKVSEHFSTMLVLSGVFNSRILDTMNYTNRDYVHVNYTLLLVIYSMLLVNGSQSKNVSYGPIAIADWSIIVQCHQTWVLASICAVVEMGILH